MRLKAEHGKSWGRLSRRELLTAGALLLNPLTASAQSSFKPLRAVNRTLNVLGRAASVFALQGADKLNLVEGGRFSLRLENDLKDGTLIHWHGLTPPSVFDGSLASQGIIKHGSSFEYDFVINRSGTHWMHSHVGLQAQKLLAAPLIVRSIDELAVDEQEHVLMLHDFTFREPEEIFEELKAGKGGHAAHAAHAAAGAAMNDVSFDAYLANDRTLEDPEVVRVEPAGRLRLRIINGCAASNLLVDLGSLEGELLAIDGNPIEQIKVSLFGLAAAQRADVRLRLPPGRGAYPILARPEGTRVRTGIILATDRAPVEMIKTEGEETAAASDIAIEARLRGRRSLGAKTAERIDIIDLGGGGSDYSWNINGNTDHGGTIARVAPGQRIEWIIRNQTTMAHPMHLHGHHFQIVAVGTARFEGAMRDTVLVPAKSEVTIAFDADNPGRWPFHCHHLYHFHAGMAGLVEYES
jgi:FtsP/CotA-like multicopper oxidase with cupredoxin domain